MLDKLITEGEALEAETTLNELKKKDLSGENYHKWATKCVLFLEEAYPQSSITRKVIELNKNLVSNCYDNYEFLLGSIKGIKEIE